MLPSHSAAIHEAIASRRDASLAEAYLLAWEEGECDIWEAAVADGPADLPE